jgi:hypothetical protein
MAGVHDERMVPGPRRLGALHLGARAVAVIAVLSLAACSSAVTGTTARLPASYAVPAVSEPLTTDANSPVAHDTETDAIVEQDGRLYATTDQWEYPGPSPHGQILVKDSATAPWRVLEETQGLRVQDTMASFAIPADQGLGPGHSLLITEAVIGGRKELQWLIDRASSFAPADSYVLPSDVIDVRAFGAFESGGQWAVYAGVDPTGILRGAWSPVRHTLVFDPVPELTAAGVSVRGTTTGKVTGFAACAGALYATIHTRLYRRNNGFLPPGTTRWVQVYHEPPVGPHNSGLRGLTCISHDGAPALLLSTEGNGDVYRFDHLPAGQLDGTTEAASAPLLVPVREFAPIPAIRHMLVSEGYHVPASGPRSIVYVIAAYNNFTTITTGGSTAQVFGFEWAYAGGCPPRRVCGPVSAHGAAFDAAACFAVRTQRGDSPPSYGLRCLSGPDFTLRHQPAEPIRNGQAFVSVRTIALSPFSRDQVFYGGYDCNFYPADGTAWVASSTLSAIRIGDVG